MKVKFYLLLFFCLLGDAHLYAADGVTLVVYTNDGTQTMFDLDRQPVSTFEDGYLVIRFTDGGSDTEVTYKLAELQKFVYMKDGSSLSVTEHQLDPSSFSVRGGAMVFSTVPAGTSVTVVSVDGSVVFERRMASNGTLRLPLSQLPHGVFVAKVGSHSYKIRH